LLNNLVYKYEIPIKKNIDSEKDSSFWFPSITHSSGNASGLFILIKDIGISDNQRFGSGIAHAYEIKSGISAYFYLGPNIYREANLFGLIPSKVENNLVTVYSKNEIDLKGKKTNLRVRMSMVNEDDTEYCYDKFMGTLNPLIQLLSYLKKNENEIILLRALRYGFISGWTFDRNKEIGIQSVKKIVDKLKDKNISIHSKNIKEKIENGAVSILSSNMELFRQLYLVSVSGDQYSSMRIFKEFIDAIPNNYITSQRIKNKEFPVEFSIFGLEIHFKVSTIREKALLIVEELNKLGKTELLSDYGGLHRFSIYLDIPSAEMDFVFLINRLIEPAINAIIEKIDQQQLLWRHVSKDLIWIKAIYMRLYTPIHFEQTILASMTEIGWFPILIKERPSKDGFNVDIKLLCDYPLYKKDTKEKDWGSKILDLYEKKEISEDDIKGLDKLFYKSFYHIDLPMDISFFYSTLYRSLKEKFNYSPY
jgi:hypothetical protein